MTAKTEGVTVTLLVASLFACILLAMLLVGAVFRFLWWAIEGFA